MVARRRRNLHQLDRVQVAQVVAVVDGVLGPGQGAAVLAILHPGLHHHRVVGQPLLDGGQAHAGQEGRLGEYDLGAGEAQVFIHVVLADRQPYAIGTLAGGRGGGGVASGGRLVGAAGHQQQRCRTQHKHGEQRNSFHRDPPDSGPAAPRWDGRQDHGRVGWDMADVKEALDGRGVRHLGVRREGAVVTVTMNRPERRNALHAAAHAELAAVFDAYAADRETRVLVLTETRRTRPPAARRQRQRRSHRESPTTRGHCGRTRRAPRTPRRRE